MNFSTSDMTETTPSGLWTTAAPDDGRNPVRGFICCAVSVLFFGSNFIPVKKFPTGDGMFFQWVLCGAIWLSGLVVQCVRHFPPFYPLAMLGGFLWTTGNIFVVPIIHFIGLSQGLLIYVTFNMLSGWVSGRFGWFGLHAEVPKNTTMNYIGMALCLCSAFLYILIKTNPNATDTQRSNHDQTDEDASPILAGQPVTQQSYGSVNHEAVSVPETAVISPGDNHSDSDDPSERHKNQTNINQSGLLDKIPHKSRRVIGVVLAILVGLMFGVNFAPVIYIQDNYTHDNVTVSQNGLDYVFSHFSGIYLTSTVYFMLYCAVMKNRPSIYPTTILPAFVSGVMWAIADIAWFIANSDLSEPITFPIISSGPGMLAAIWGMVLFKEISGRRNILILLLAFCVTVTGSVLSGLSLK